MNFCSKGSHFCKEEYMEWNNIGNHFDQISSSQSKTGDSFSFRTTEVIACSLVFRINFTSGFICCHFSGKRRERTHRRSRSVRKITFFLFPAILNTTFRLFAMAWKRNEDNSHLCRISLEKSTKTLRINQSVLFETRQFHSFICMRVWFLCWVEAPKFQAFLRVNWIHFTFFIEQFAAKI